MAHFGLSSLLVEEGLLSDTDQRTIRSVTGNNATAFARAIIALGLVDEDELAALLVERTGKAMVAKDLLAESDRATWGTVDRPLLERLEVVPLRIDDEKLYIAMIDPLDRDVRRQLEFFTGYKVVPVIATLSQIRAALAKLIRGYEPPHSSLEDLLDNHALAAARRQRLIRGGRAGAGALAGDGHGMASPDRAPPAKISGEESDSLGGFGGAFAEHPPENATDTLLDDFEGPGEHGHGAGEAGNRAAAGHDDAAEASDDLFAEAEGDGAFDEGSAHDNASALQELDALGDGAETARAREEADEQNLLGELDESAFEAGGDLASAAEMTSPGESTPQNVAAEDDAESLGDYAALDDMVAEGAGAGANDLPASGQEAGAPSGEGDESLENFGMDDEAASLPGLAETTDGQDRDASASPPEEKEEKAERAPSGDDELASFAFDESSGAFGELDENDAAQTPRSNPPSGESHVLEVNEGLSSATTSSASTDDVLGSDEDLSDAFDTFESTPNASKRQTASLAELPSFAEETPLEGFDVQEELPLASSLEEAPFPEESLARDAARGEADDLTTLDDLEPIDPMDASFDEAWKSPSSDDLAAAAPQDLDASQAAIAAPREPAAESEDTADIDVCLADPLAEIQLQLDPQRGLWMAAINQGMIAASLAVDSAAVRSKAAATFSAAGFGDGVLLNLAADGAVSAVMSWTSQDAGIDVQDEPSKLLAGKGSSQAIAKLAAESAQQPSAVPASLAQDAAELFALLGDPASCVSATVSRRDNTLVLIAAADARVRQDSELGAAVVGFLRHVAERIS